MDLGLKGKYALVTGGTHGIGLAIAERLAGEGANVAVCSHTEERIAEAVSRIKQKGVEALGLTADVLVPADIERVMTAMIAAWGTIHILVNNVGGGGRWGSEVFEDAAEEVWRDLYEKNAMAAVRFTRLAVPFMKRQRWGRVVTVSSIQGREGGGRPWYAMAKAAEIALMKSFAMSRDLARAGITFNSVAPGGVMIPGTAWEREAAQDPERFREVVSHLPLGRLGTPEEVASVAAFLSSQAASWVNGACIAIDGGEGRSF